MCRAYSTPYGDFQPRVAEFRDGAGKQPQTIVEAIFLAVLEEHLHSQTNAKDRYACIGGGENGAVEMERTDAGHGIGKRANAGEDDVVGGGKGGGGVGDEAGDGKKFERLLDAAEIAHAVVEDGNHGEKHLLEGKIRKGEGEKKQHAEELW